MEASKTKIRSIGVITHPEVPKDFVQKVAGNLRRKGVGLVFDPLAAGKTNEKETNIRDMDIDLAVILGGDGTLLWSVNELRGSPLILGINTGRIGYLAELDAKNMEKNLKKLFSGEFLVDERAKLRQRWDILNRLSPEGRQRVREIFPHYNQLPDDRRKAVHEEFHSLRDLSPAERERRLASPEFQKSFSPAEQQLLKDLAGLLR